MNWAGFRSKWGDVLLPLNEEAATCLSYLETEEKKNKCVWVVFVYSIYHFKKMFILNKVRLDR